MNPEVSSVPTNELVLYEMGTLPSGQKEITLACFGLAV